MQNKLFQHRWLPENPRAILFILHGIFEHGARYEHVAKLLNKAQIGVVAFDYRGHGRSPGEMGYIDHWSTLVADTNQWVKAVKSEFGNIPHFIFGHSLGGLLLMSYLAVHKPKFQGVILSSAALKVKEDLSPILQKLAPVLALLAPKLKTIKLDPNLVSRDQVEIDKYINDPLIYHGRIAAQTGNETLKATKTIDSSFQQFNWPVLIMHGTDDGLTEPSGSKVFFEKAGTKDKTLKLYDGCRHELVNELDKEVVLADLKQWILARM
jgi:alpha-beta hydrolase superfamily lysophospholipase